jgi:hypothetical protein
MGIQRLQRDLDNDQEQEQQQNTTWWLTDL